MSARVLDRENLRRRRRAGRAAVFVLSANCLRTRSFAGRVGIVARVNSRAARWRLQAFRGASPAGVTSFHLPAWCENPVEPLCSLVVRMLISVCLFVFLP